jgi:hypothetical protein
MNFNCEFDSGWGLSRIFLDIPLDFRVLDGDLTRRDLTVDEYVDPLCVSHYENHALIKRLVMFTLSRLHNLILLLAFQPGHN